MRLIQRVLQTASDLGERSPAFLPTTHSTRWLAARVEAGSRYSNRIVERSGVSQPRLSRSYRFASSNGSLRWRRHAVQDCARSARVLGTRLIGRVHTGDLVHILLLIGLMLLLLAFLRARDAACGVRR